MRYHPIRDWSWIHSFQLMLAVDPSKSRYTALSPSLLISVYVKSSCAQSSSASEACCAVEPQLFNFVSDPLRDFREELLRDVESPDFGERGLRFLEEDFFLLDGDRRRSKCFDFGERRLKCSALDEPWRDLLFVLVCVSDDELSLD